MCGDPTQQPTDQRCKQRINSKTALKLFQKFLMVGRINCHRGCESIFLSVFGYRLELNGMEFTAPTLQRLQRMIIFTVVRRNRFF